MDEWTLIPIKNTDWLAYVFGFNFLLFVLCKQQFNQQFFSFFRVIDTPLYFSSYGERFVLQQGFVLLSVLFSLINTTIFIGFFLTNYTTLSFDISTFFILFGGLSIKEDLNYCINYPNVVAAAIGNPLNYGEHSLQKLKSKLNYKTIRKC